MALELTPRVLNTISMTCVEDGLSHRITDEQMIAGLRARTGCYLAVCSHTVTAAAMVAPDGRPCPRCHNHHASLPDLRYWPGKHRQRRWLWRMLGGRLWRLLGGQRSPIPGSIAASAEGVSDGRLS